MSRDSLSRRAWLEATSFAGLTFATSPWSSRLLAAPAERAPAKACILIFLEGGPSQFETFDPKPGAPNGGPTEGIDTKLPGVKFAGNLPKLAAIADRLAVIRTLHSMEGDHERASVLVHTGYSPNPRLTYPGLGSSVARHLDDPSADVPAFVAIGNTAGPGILGPKFGPMTIQDVNNFAPSLNLPEGFSEARIERRLQALEAFNSGFSESFQSPLAGDLTTLTRRSDRMRKSSVFRPYDVAGEEPENYEKYGGGAADFLARACLAARRLVEAGVKFVEISYGGWDTHGDNFNQVQALAGPLDAALSALVTDLADRGLLEQTLVVCVGEFGRTPQINGDNGRDHFPDVFSALLAGGGLKAGQVIGVSSDDGVTIKDRPVGIPDFHATLFAALGLDVTKNHFAPDGRLLRLTNNGKPLEELLPVIPS